ncbi:hypothetical protein [Pseudonocardia sp. N23]|uniref:hypothetical protein n=1 Tax=Pseudonocardia sp. N23 TaxID=1987376 RepID=UPI000C02CC9E|nr:hypothetical protein [Pseudonocardia sp. N23]GAY11229.1 hypothetical protein TOK_5736 [Pseudonocardia sp. N23]
MIVHRVPPTRLPVPGVEGVAVPRIAARGRIALGVPPGVTFGLVRAGIVIQLFGHLGVLHRAVVDDRCGCGSSRRDIAGDPLVGVPDGVARRLVAADTRPAPTPHPGRHTIRTIPSRPGCPATSPTW